MTEQEFKADPDLREQLAASLYSPAFQTALKIVTKRNQLNEIAAENNNLDASPERSLRLFNQRLGREGVISDIFDMLTPNGENPVDPPSDFGEPEAYRKLLANTEK